SSVPVATRWYADVWLRAERPHLRNPYARPCDFQQRRRVASRAQDRGNDRARDHCDSGAENAAGAPPESRSGANRAARGEARRRAVRLAGVAAGTVRPDDGPTRSLSDLADAATDGRRYLRALRAHAGADAHAYALLPVPSCREPCIA